MLKTALRMIMFCCSYMMSVASAMSLLTPTGHTRKSYLIFLLIGTILTGSIYMMAESDNS